MIALRESYNQSGVQSRTTSLSTGTLSVRTLRERSLRKYGFASVSSHGRPLCDRGEVRGLLYAPRRAPRRSVSSARSSTGRSRRGRTSSCPKGSKSCGFGSRFGKRFWRIRVRVGSLCHEGRLVDEFGDILKGKGPSLRQREVASGRVCEKSRTGVWNEL